MNSKESTYRSLVIRKVQQLAKEHGSLAKIPKELQQRLGFDVIAKRKGTSISVRIPSGNLDSRIAELKRELPSVSFQSAKPNTEPIFGKYTPVPSFTNQTMDDFWIAQGWYREDRVGIKLIRGKWKDDEKVQREAIRFLVDKVLKKDPREITMDNFKSNGLGGLISEYYNNSPHAALTEAGYLYSIQESLQHARPSNFQRDRFYPWEMVMTPAGVYNSKENRVAATKWLVWKLKKDPRDITYELFYLNRLLGLIQRYYNGSPYAALTDAGYQLHPWEMLKTPNGLYDSKENRVAATKWLIGKLKKDPRDITQDDFRSNRLGGLLTLYYNNGSHKAFLEAGLVPEADEGDMWTRNRSPG